MNEILLVAIALVFILLLIDVPIFVAFLAGAMLVLVGSFAFPLEMVASTIYRSGLNRYSFLAVPLYIFAGDLMLHSGASRDLVRVADSFMGHLPGGLASSAILGCMVFSALTGSSLACAAAIGSVTIPPMVEAGYPKRFAMGLLATGGTLGILIPPSICMIIYGTVTGASIAKLFVAGVIPGILLGSMLIAHTIIVCGKKGYGRHPKATWQERGQSLTKAWTVMLMPVIILGGIYGGIFSATEAGAIACVYALLLCFTSYRKQVTFKQYMADLIDTARATTMIWMILIGASLFAQALTLSGVADAITTFINSLGLGWAGILALVNILLLVAGCFLETTSIAVVFIPLLWGALMGAGVDPVHFGIVFTVAIMLAVITPPVAGNLFVIAASQNEPASEVIKGTIPFYLTLLVGLAIITFVPQLSLFLPNLME